MNSRKISRFFVYFFLTVGALIMLLPFFWMFSSAFKTTQEINRFPPQWLPSHLSLENFKRAFEISLSIVYYVVKEHCKCSCISAKTSFCNCGLYGCQLRAVQPADGNRMVRNCKTEFIKSYDGII